MTVDERILKSAAEGVSVCELAAEHGMGEGEVLAILDRAAEAWFKGDHLRRELLLEVERLNLLEKHFFAKALADGEGAMTAGALFVKVAERKATLIGLNAASQSASVIIHQSIPAKQVSSMERIREVLDRLRELPAPEGANGEALEGHEG